MNEQVLRCKVDGGRGRSFNPYPTHILCLNHPRIVLEILRGDLVLRRKSVFCFVLNIKRDRLFNFQALPCGNSLTAEHCCLDFGRAWRFHKINCTQSVNRQRCTRTIYSYSRFSSSFIVDIVPFSITAIKYFSLFFFFFWLCPTGPNFFDYD